MSDFLSNLITRTQQPLESGIRPRVASWFEPITDAPPLPLDFEQQAEAIVGNQPFPPKADTTRQPGLPREEPAADLRQRIATAHDTDRPAVESEPVPVLPPQRAEALPGLRKDPLLEHRTPDPGRPKEPPRAEPEPSRERTRPTAMPPGERHERRALLTGAEALPTQQAIQQPSGADRMQGITPTVVAAGKVLVSLAPAAADEPIPAPAREAPKTDRQRALPAERPPARDAVRPHIIATPALPERVRNEEQRATAAPTIRVSIGRIEVRAQSPVASQQQRQASQPPPRRAPALSLDQYLKQRDEGAR